LILNAAGFEIYVDALIDLGVQSIGDVKNSDLVNQTILRDIGMNETSILKFTTIFSCIAAHDNAAML